MYTNVADMPFAVNSKETGTIPASQILKPLWRLTCRSSQSSLTIKHYNTRVFLPYTAVPSGHKFGFSQSYSRSYGGIVPVFIEFTGLLSLVYIDVHWCTSVYIGVHWCTLVYIGVHWCTLYILGNIGVHK